MPNYGVHFAKFPEHDDTAKSAINRSATPKLFILFLEILRHDEKTGDLDHGPLQPER
jgi:hypothetical protein